MRSTTGSRLALWLVLLVLVGQAVGIRPEHFADQPVTSDFSSITIPVADALRQADLPVLSNAPTGAQYDLAVAVLECKELEEDDVHCSPLKDKCDPDPFATGRLSGVAAHFAASLPAQYGLRALIAGVSLQLFLGVFRL